MPGSGKTYDVVANQILPGLKAGRLVVTNIPLNEDIIRQTTPDAKISAFPIEQILTSPELIDQYAAPGCILVLDEVWRIWPSGQKAHQVPEPFRKLLAEHRHMVDEDGNSMQIVLVTQDLAQIGAFARQLVEQTFYHTKLSHVGASGSYRIDVYHGPQTGPSPPRQARIREILGRYDRHIFPFYQSHTMSRSDKPGANESSVVTRGNIWKRPMLWITAAACVLFLIWGVPKARSLLHDPSGKGIAPASVATGRAPSPLVETTRTTVEAPPGRPWRISGSVEYSDGAKSRAMLTDGLVTVTVPLERFCERFVDTWLVCQWQGREVTPHSAVADRAPLDLGRSRGQDSPASPAVLGGT